MYHLANSVGSMALRPKTRYLHNNGEVPVVQIDQIA